MRMRLKELRKQAGFTQKEIGEMLGISQNHYSYIELGKIRPRKVHLEILAEKYGVSIEYLRGIVPKNSTNFYKVKFAKNQEVWYINYVTSVYNCPHCGEECYEESIDGVKKGIVAYITIKDGDLSNCTEELKISYTIIAETIRGKHLYTGRSEEDVFATEEEALNRLKELTI